MENHLKITPRQGPEEGIKYFWLVLPKHSPELPPGHLQPFGTRTLPQNPLNWCCFGFFQMIQNFQDESCFVLDTMKGA